MHFTHKHRGSEYRGGPGKVGRLKEKVKNTERDYLDFVEERHLVTARFGQGFPISSA